MKWKKDHKMPNSKAKMSLPTSAHQNGKLQDSLFDFACF
jgi:hypothetical protein